MKTYKIEISSRINPDVGQICFVKSELNRGFLMDMLCPLTTYRVLIEELYETPAYTLNLEEFLKIFKDLKLKTKVAKNVTDIIKGDLALFATKPELDLNVCLGNTGTRTYINNVSFDFLNAIFPNIFKFDPKSKTPYFEGELTLNQIDYGRWHLFYRKTKETIVYEIIVLEK